MKFSKRVQLILICLLFSPILVQSAELRSEYPNRYVVQQGDTLWGIAEMYFEDPWRWQELWHQNPDIDDPDKIYPGDIIEIVYIDGSPRLMVIGHQSHADIKSVKISPRVRKMPLRVEVPLIPMNVIKHFVVPARVEEEAVLQNAAYVGAIAPERVMASIHDHVYVRGLDEIRKDGYGIYRAGEPYLDPETEEILGFEVLYLGDARLKRSGDPATLVVTKAKQEILISDIVLPREETALLEGFVPHAPDFDLKATILSVYGGVSQIGQYDLVMLNKGERDAVREGAILAVYKDGEWVHDPRSQKFSGEHFKLPNERAGVMMVVKVFNKVSMGIILKATRAIHLYDVAVNP